LIPGARLVWDNEVVPTGQTANEYEDAMREAMSESQEMAAIVAERAAGLHVPVPRGRLMVVYFSETSRSKNALKLGDMLIAINGRRTPTRAQVHHALANVKPGATVGATVLRRGKYVDINIPTMNYDGRPALGVYLTTIYERPRLPVSVAYHLPQVSGSSAGLMFALDIYRSITGSHPNVASVAGTGTIAYDGSVGAIEGTRQKVVAAEHAGADVFLVPTDNYAEVKDMHGIRIVPVTNFDQALGALGIIPRKRLSR
jgi:PDZ domain-containing protein